MFGDLFGGLFGETSAEEKKKVEIDLYSRVKDLELALAGRGGSEGEGALARISDRVIYEEVVEEDRKRFQDALRADLEIAILHNLIRTEREDGGILDPPGVRGKKSVASAMTGARMAEEGLWSLAAVYFRHAREYAPSFWLRSTKVTQEIAIKLRAVHDPPPVSEDEFEKGYCDRLNVPRNGDRLIEAQQAKTPLEWIELWHTYCKDSLAFRGLINDAVLEAAREGLWEEWISYEVPEDAEPDRWSMSWDREPKKGEKTKWIQFTPRGISSSGTGSEWDRLKRTRLGQHLATIEDPDAKQQIGRILKIFWWACGFEPIGKVKLRKLEDDRWYFTRYETQYGSSEKIWKENHNLWPEEGVKDHAQALRFAWTINIYTSL